MALQILAVQIASQVIALLEIDHHVYALEL